MGQTQRSERLTEAEVAFLVGFRSLGHAARRRFTLALDILVSGALGPDATAASLLTAADSALIERGLA